MWFPLELINNSTPRSLLLLEQSFTLYNESKSECDPPETKRQLYKSVQSQSIQSQSNLLKNRFTQEKAL